MSEPLVASWNSEMGWTDTIKSDLDCYKGEHFLRLSIKENRVDEGIKDLTVCFPLEMAEGYLTAILERIRDKRKSLSGGDIT